MATTTNTAYKVHIQEATQNEVDSVNIEQGAMLVTDEALFMGFNNEQVRVYPPQSDKMGLGWARYDDTQYTTASPYSFNTTAFVVPNNKGNVLDSHIHSDTDFYANNKLKAEFENDVYIVTIAFKAKISNANGYMEVYLEGGNGTPYDRVRDIITFPKGNNVEHSYARTFQYYSDDDVVTNGISVKMLASHSGQLHDVIYFIQRTQNHKYQ
jgi:hypothetical protein